MQDIGEGRFPNLPDKNLVKILVLPFAISNIWKNDSRNEVRWHYGVVYVLIGYNGYMRIAVSVVGGQATGKVDPSQSYPGFSVGN